MLSITGSKASTLGRINPIRYRGYVYDNETGLYYLQSRYYNPETGRFINADVFVSTGQGFVGNNMFAYCLNNPVMYSDSYGKRATIASRDITSPHLMMFDSTWSWIYHSHESADRISRGTISYGLTGSLYGGAGVTGAIGHISDSEGNGGIVVTGGGGGGTPSGGGGLYLSLTDAPTIYDTRGLATGVGGSIAVIGALTIETMTFNDPEDSSITYSGINISLGLKSAIAVPAELHGYATTSEILWDYNFWDVVIDVLSFLSGV